MNVFRDEAINSKIYNLQINNSTMRRQFVFFERYWADEQAWLKEQFGLHRVWEHVRQWLDTKSTDTHGMTSQHRGAPWGLPPTPTYLTLPHLTDWLFISECLWPVWRAEDFPARHSDSTQIHITFFSCSAPESTIASDLASFEELKKLRDEKI